MASEPDPVAHYTSETTGNVARLRSVEGSKLFQCHENASCDLAKNRDYTSLWCLDPDISVTGDDRLDQAGDFYLVCAATTSVPDGTTLGMLELHYDIEFYSPRLQLSAIERASEFTFDNATFTSLFTGGAKLLIDTLMDYLVDNLSSLPTTIAQFIRMYVSTLGTTSYRIGSDSPIDGGWPNGVYSFQVAMCFSNSAAAAKPASSLKLYHRIDWADGYSDTSGPEAWDTVVNYRAANGVLYAVAILMPFDFGIAGTTRGFLDYLVDMNPTTIIPDILELRFKAAGTSEFFELPLTEPSSLRGRSHRGRVVAQATPKPKLESKVVTYSALRSLVHSESLRSRKIPDGAEAKSMRRVTDHDDHGYAHVTSIMPTPPASPPPPPSRSSIRPEDNRSSQSSSHLPSAGRR